MDNAHGEAIGAEVFGYESADVLIGDSVENRKGVQTVIACEIRLRHGCAHSAKGAQGADAGAVGGLFAAAPQGLVQPVFGALFGLGDYLCQHLFRIAALSAQQDAGGSVTKLNIGKEFGNKFSNKSGLIGGIILIIIGLEIFITSLI